MDTYFGQNEEVSLNTKKTKKGRKRWEWEE